MCVNALLLFTHKAVHALAFCMHSKPKRGGVLLTVGEIKKGEGKKKKEEKRETVEDIGTNTVRLLRVEQRLFNHSTACIAPKL